MKILVFADDVDLSIISKADVALAIAEDRKGFYIEKHRFLPITGNHRHMSELRHILLAGSQAGDVDGYHGIEGGWPDGQDDSR